MEILSETVHSGEFFFFIGILSIVAVVCAVMAIGFIVDFISKKKIDANYAAGFLVTAVLSVFLGIFISVSVKQGAHVTYRATVSDYNQVYEQGYEVIGHEGEIVLLQKYKDKK